jgi:hypothetical protein
MQDKSVTKQLKYDFTAIEAFENAQQLARKNQALVEAQLKRKHVASNMKADEESINAEIQRYARYVNDGFDFRDTECRVVLNSPHLGLKRIIRVDTGEIVEECRMEEHEKQERLPLQ